MKGYLSVKVNGEEVVSYKGNDLHRYEVDRAFRLMASVQWPGSLGIRADLLLRGDHPPPSATTRMGQIDYMNGEITGSTGGAALSSTGEIMRFRYKASRLNNAPASPNQKAFAINRIRAQHISTNPSPNGVVSAVDINLNQIGNVFAHPTGRRAFFNETAIVATGVGVLTPGGPAVFAPGEEGAYIFDVRIKTSGDATSARYLFRRRPYNIGSYEPGAGAADSLVSAAADTPATRMSVSNGSRATVSLANLIPNQPSPTPSTLPYDADYPTAAAAADVVAAGMAFDGLKNGRFWWATTNIVGNSNANAIQGRSIWSWRRYTGEEWKREDTTLTGFPVIGSTVQYRDVKTTRGGFVLIAMDGNDQQNSTGATDGGLLIINPTTSTVIQVLGAAAGGIYTLGGLSENNCLGIAVDKSELHSGAGFDRVWVLHRTGLTFFDINIATGAVGARSTVQNAGGTFNTLAAGSQRGLGGWTPSGIGAAQNMNNVLIDVDSNGDVYWISAPLAAGIHRLNRVLGVVAHTHAFYSLDSAAEGGSLGFCTIGNDVTGAVGREVSGLLVHRRDAVDPQADDLWLSTGYGSNSSARFVVRIPVDRFVAGNDPGVGYAGTQFTTSATNQATVISVAPDGSVVVTTTSTDTHGLLESLGRKIAASGTLSAITAGGLITATTGIFTSGHVGRGIQIEDFANAANNGFFKITAFTSSTQVTVDNPSAVGEAGATAGCAIQDFDSDPTLAGTGQGTQTTGNFHYNPWNMFADDSGIVWSWVPRILGNVSKLAIHYMPISYQWSGAAWYRSIFPTLATGRHKVAHTGAEALTGGVTAAFGNGGGGPNIFVANEYYTFSVAKGLVKDATQEVTWSYDIFSEKTELVAGAEALTNKTCVDSSVRGGFINVGSLASVLTQDPFTPLTATQRLQLGHHQRRIALDGTNNTLAIGPLSGNITTVNGWQLAIDIGSDVVASRVLFAFSGYNTLAWDETQIELYSSTAAAGSASWTLRHTFRTDQDHPYFNLRPDAFHNVAGGSNFSTGCVELEVDLDNQFAPANGSGDQIAAPANNGHQVLTDAAGLFTQAMTGRSIIIAGGNAANNGRFTVTRFISNTQIEYRNPTGVAEALFAGTWTFESNTAARYWKIAVRSFGTSSATDGHMVGVAAFDSSGVPLGMTNSKYLLTSPDVDYLANYVLRGVFVQDEGTGGTAARGPGNNQVTLTADSFTGVAANDFFRLKMAGVGNGTTDSISAPNYDGEQTLTIGAAAFIAAQVGGTVIVQGATNPLNNGAFRIVAVPSATTVRYQNSTGVAQASYGGSWDITAQERRVSTVDSATQITVASNFDAAFTAQDWEVVRNADVRPRDNEGGSEQNARLPSIAGEVFICPVTGHIFYHADDVAAARTFRVLRYVKVKRSP